MFRIDTNSTHGLGWIANCDIPADTPILDEQAALVIAHADMFNKEAVDRSIKTLSTSDLNSFHRLYGRNLTEKFYFNGTPLRDFEKDYMGSSRNGQVGLFLQCARLNHSCRPNAARALGSDQVNSVVAQSNILKGEEITISYLDDIFVDTATRSVILKSKAPTGSGAFEHGCRCRLCLSDNKEKQESDLRRKKLAQYRDQLIRGQPGCLPNLMRLLNMERIPMSSIGNDAIVKFVQVSGLAPSSKEKYFSTTFRVGTRVYLHKLKQAAELNGALGTVVTSYNEATKRVSVKMDDSQLRTHPVAVKPENLCITTRK